MSYLQIADDFSVRVKGYTVRFSFHFEMQTITGLEPNITIHEMELSVNE